MATLWVTRGLPASGKSTWAFQQVRALSASEDAARVNRDDLRAQMFADVKHTPDQEKIVTVAERAMVKNLLDSGTSVIVDATNLRAETLKKWRSLAATCHAGFIVVDFPASMEECIERNEKRAAEGGRYVDEAVIRRMAKRYPIKKWKRFDGEENVRPWRGYTHELHPGGGYAIICDLDGTLALNTSGRGWFDEDKVGNDSVNYPVLRALDGILEIYPGAELVFLSGRSTKCYDITEKWLEENVLGYFDGGVESYLAMRQEGDYRPDDIVKFELYMKHLSEKNIIAVFDDRLSVCRMWNEIGLPLFRVGDPDADF